MGSALANFALHEALAGVGAGGPNSSLRRTLSPLPRIPVSPGLAPLLVVLSLSAKTNKDKRIFIELMTSDRKLKASRESLKC